MASRGDGQMIPPLTNPVWTELVKGTTDPSFRLTVASMFFFSLRNQFAKDPSRLPALIQEAHKFFRRYESILGDDIKRLFG
jgi:hypothetical protein